SPSRNDPGRSSLGLGHRGVLDTPGRPRRVVTLGDEGDVVRGVGEEDPPGQRDRLLCRPAARGTDRNLPDQMPVDEDRDLLRIGIEGPIRELPAAAPAPASYHDLLR